VIAIIALLISILLPALGSAKSHARCAREQGVMHQQLVAYSGYLGDYKDKCLPAAPHWGWAHDYGASRVWMRPPDPFNPPGVMYATVTKIWSWHFISNVNYALTAWQLDKATYEDFIARPNQASGGGLNDYAANSATQAFNYHPSFGMNGVYVGGAYT